MLTAGDLMPGYTSLIGSCQVAEVNSVVILSSSDVMYILKTTGGMGWPTSSHLVALGKCVFWQIL